MSSANAFRLDWSQILSFGKELTILKTFADDRISKAQVMISVFDWVENIVRKGENAGDQHFLLFPQCF